MGGLEWFAYAFLLPGVYFAGKKNNYYGWLMQAIGCMLLVIFASIFHIWGIVFANTIFTTMTLMAYFTQKKLKSQEGKKIDKIIS